MSEGPETPGFQFGLADILFAIAAGGLWLALVLLLGDSPNVGPAVILLVLTGIMVAVQRLLRGHRHAWSLAAILAPIIAILCLISVALWVNRE